ncbi:dUTPase [Bacillus cereus]|uniref:dUTPase n=1 Tax=Bacillus cereus TaxID=1396 RepID=UPI001C8CD533|nr:dUTPase [Bacillus cereus]MBX9158378.1 dUTPase [Bacillus cereus]
MGINLEGLKALDAGVVEKVLEAAELLKMLEVPNGKVRGFEVVDDGYMQHKEVHTKLPYKGSEKAAAFDFFSKEDVELKVGEQYTFVTDIKAYMLEDEVLSIYPRSGHGTKHRLMLANTTGIIDMDYYYNEKTGGNIAITLYNNGKEDYFIQQGERIAQAIFSKKLDADENTYTGGDKKRVGGHGSSGKF